MYIYCVHRFLKLDLIEAAYNLKPETVALADKMSSFIQNIKKNRKKSITSLKK